MNINKVLLSGNLTRDAEVRSTAGGTNVISFGLAVNERKKNAQTGEWEEVPNFVDCTMFDSTGNRQWIANALRKGFKVYVEGSLRYSSWQDRDTGKNRSKLEVIVRDIDANWPPRQQAPQGYGQPYQQQAQQYQQAPQGYRQQPQQYQQAPQGYQQSYAQPASAPQQPAPANYTQAPQMRPQQAPQAPQQPAQQPAPPMQQQMAMPQQPARPPVTQAPPVDVYDEDIPF